MISKKLFAILLALCMVLSIMPAGLVAFADDDPEALHVGKNTVVSGTTYTFTPEEDGNYWFCSVSDFDVKLTVVNTETGDESYFDDYEEEYYYSLNFCNELTLNKNVTYVLYPGDFMENSGTFNLYINPDTGYGISKNVQGSEGYIETPLFAEAGQEVSFIPQGCNPLIVVDQVYLVNPDNQEPYNSIECSEKNGIYSFVMPSGSVEINVVFAESLEGVIPLTAGINEIEDGSTGKVRYSFTPEKETFYAITSDTYASPQLVIYQPGNDYPDYYGDEIEDRDFYTVQRMEEGITYYLIVDFRDSEVTGGTITIEEKPPIIPAGHSLVLSGEIGLIFNFEALQSFPLNDAYVEFKTGNFGTQRAMLYNVEADVVAATCYIPAYRMADEVTPVVHYSEDGVDKTVEFEPYSVEDYINYVTEDWDLYSDATVNLAEALANYGFYTQNYLKNLHGYPVGEGGKYAEMNTAFTDFGYPDENNSGYYYSIYRNLLQEWSDYDKDVDENRVEKATVSLNLEDTVSLYLYLTVKDGVTLSRATALFEGDDEEDTRDIEVNYYSDNVFRVEIRDIKAYDLGKYIQIDVYDENDDGTASYTLAPLTYASLAMANENIAPEFADALCSLYDYYEASLEARDNGQDVPHPLEP